MNTHTRCCAAEFLERVRLAKDQKDLIEDHLDATFTGEASDGRMWSCFVFDDHSAVIGIDGDPHELRAVAEFEAMTFHGRQGVP